MSKKYKFSHNCIEKLPTIPQTFIATVQEFTQKRKPLIKYLASNSWIKSAYMGEENCFGVL
jgi:hypothetical protein